MWRLVFLESLVFSVVIGRPHSFSAGIIFNNDTTLFGKTRRVRAMIDEGTVGGQTSVPKSTDTVCPTGILRGDSVVVDGDMLIPKSRFDVIFLSQNRSTVPDPTGSNVRRALMPDYTWDNAVVPYSFVQLERDLMYHGKSMAEIEAYKRLLLDAMDEFSAVSALTFREANASTDPYVLEIVSGYPDNSMDTFVTGGGSWCWSYVGDVRLTTMFIDNYVGVTRMNLDVFDNYGQCWTKSTLVHELGHAVGMYHEQQRTDRDLYIVVDACGLSANNEVQHASDSKSISYDFKSIMHYTMAGIGTYGANLTAKGAELLAEQYLTKYDVGRQTRLSELDIKGLQSLYGAPLKHNTIITKTNVSLGAGVIVAIVTGGVLFVVFVGWRLSKPDVEYVPLLL